MDELNLAMDWQCSRSHWLGGEGLPPQSWRDRLAQELPGHLWLKTSGSTGNSKWVGLAKSAFLAAADGVNEHLQVTPQDRWLCVLPVEHVGGLSLFARAFLSNSEVVRPLHWQWSAQRFLEVTKQERITLCSLVPTQIFDLIRANARAPQTLRAVLVGGGRLEQRLYEQGRKLGWPLLPCYGMTETAAQFATAELKALSSPTVPPMKKLKHMELKMSDSGLLQMRSKCLLSAYLLTEQDDWVLQRPFDQEGWFTTQDLAQLSQDGYVTALGRQSTQVKVSGHLVDVEALASRWRHWLSSQGYDDNVQLMAVPHPRKENELISVAEVEWRIPLETLAKAFNNQLPAQEKIKRCYWVTKIPTSSLGKVRWPELRHILGYGS